MSEFVASSVRVYYVAGYGRSRSTVLGMLLGRQHAAVVLGEAHNARRPYAQKKVCTCGATAGACDYWEELVNFRWKRSARWQVRLIESAVGLLLPKYVLRMWSLRIKLTSSMSYMDWLHSHLQRASELGFSALVDTSKSTREAAARPVLYALAGAPVTVQMPTRNIDDVIASVKAAWVRRGKKPTRYLSIRVRLSRGLSYTLARVGAMRAGSKLTWLSLEGNHELTPFPGDHLIAGNRMRRLDSRSAETEDEV